jgi:multidrug efflux pump subunit AcrA (membrane-fusion protein)
MLVKMKRLLPLALALLLTVSPVKATGQSLIDPEKLQDQQISLDTIQVEAGSFIKEYNVPALVHYPMQRELKSGKYNAIFVEFAVDKNEKVQKGDVLARLAVETSDAALERLEREITRLEEEMKLGVQQRNEEIKRLENTNADGLEKEKNDILLKKAKVELEHYEYLQQRRLDALKQEKKLEQEKQNGYTLIAPADGIVTDFAKLKTGDPVPANSVLMTFVQTDVVQLRISNSAGDLRYNMPVKVTIGKKNTTVVSGRVVAADGTIPEKERTGYAYIRVETEAELVDPKLSAEIVRLDNVLVVDRGAVISENGKHYVTKLVDGMLQKRYICFGTNNTDQVWLIHGVAAGDTLIAG